MRRKVPRLLLFFILLAIGTLLLPIPVFEKMRSGTIGLFSPFWKRLEGLSLRESDIKVKRLEVENSKLKEYVSLLQELLLQEKFLNSQQKSLNVELEKNEEKDAFKHKLTAHLQSIPAKIIYHSQATWNNSVWIDVGAANNPNNTKPIIAKNSPVVNGNSIVGVVDYVDEHHSRVRLISDPELSLSVRATRGDIRKRFLLESIEQLLARLSLFPGLYSDAKEKKQLAYFLSQTKAHLKKMQKEGTFYLAKGELHGSSTAKWRSNYFQLAGVGFNYDFSDDRGPARDLRTGAIIDKKVSNGQAIPLIQVNDLLVTTGLDGVFPAGFFVGEVTKIYPLKEGDYFYELEAQPTSGNLDALSLLFVLPPHSDLDDEIDLL